MKDRLPLRLKAGVALTLAWPDWIERLSGLAPDEGDCSTKWTWTIALGTNPGPRLDFFRPRS
jgi:hypothetical protein